MISCPLCVVQRTDLLSQLHPHHPHKDFAKYDFFQILSIVYVSHFLPFSSIF